MSATTGLDAERVAADWLRSKGLTLLQSRVTCRFGEIDLVMRDRRHLVLVEVKYRKNHLDDAFASVTSSKQKKLSLAAQWLFGQHPEWQALNWRFDVLALAGELAEPEVEWLQAAFELA